MSNVKSILSSRWNASSETLYFSLDKNKFPLSSILNPISYVKAAKQELKAGTTYPEMYHDYFLEPYLAGIPAMALFKVKPRERSLEHDISYSLGVIEGQRPKDIVKLPAEVMFKAGVPRVFSDTFYVNRLIRNDGISSSVNALAVRGMLAFDRRQTHETFALLRRIFDTSDVKFSTTTLRKIVMLFKQNSSVGKDSTHFDILRFYSSLAFVPTDVYEMNTLESKSKARPIRLSRFFSSEVVGREFNRYCGYNRAVMPDDPGHPKHLDRCVDDIDPFQIRMTKYSPYVVSGVTVRSADPEQSAYPQSWVQLGRIK
jgi:hypothetical protein